MSARWKLDKRDLTSAGRHALSAAIAFTGIQPLAGIDTTTWPGIKLTLLAAVVSGVLRYGQRWLANITPPGEGGVAIRT